VRQRGKLVAIHPFRAPSELPEDELESLDFGLRLGKL
jgi:hypothetical protein